MTIHPIIKQQFEYIKNARRTLHTIPETAFLEKKTQAFLLDQLKQFSPDVLEILAGTGIKAVFYGKDPKQTIAFRSDIDALDLCEQNTHDFISKHKGVMHGCGHDGHMSVLLGLCKTISENRELLNDNVVAIFQPAEEGTGGAEVMIKEGALVNPLVDKIYGLHLDPTTPSGEISLKAGSMMASAVEFDIHIKGKSAHGATPQVGIDAIVASSILVSQLQSIVSRYVDPYEKCVITIGKITGGESRNIIAENVNLYGTLRTFDEQVLTTVRAKIADTLLGLETTYGVKTSYTEVAHYPAIVNDENLTTELLSIIEPQDTHIIVEKMIAEDFSFYQREIPGLFFFLGIEQNGKYSNSLHSNMFDFDEYSLLYGLEIYRRILNINKTV